MIIACLKWRKKQNCVFRGQFTNDRKSSLRELMNDSRGKYELIYSVDCLLNDYYKHEVLHIYGPIKKLKYKFTPHCRDHDLVRNKNANRRMYPIKG